MGKLSETLHGLADHVDHYANTAIGIETTALKWTTMLSTMFHGMAAMLESSPVTIPGPAVHAPGGK
jgi:hypothetical protein